MKPGMFGDKVPIGQTSDARPILTGQHIARIAGVLEEQPSNCEVKFAAIHMLSIL
jgi:hypothetical protein